MDLQRAGKDPSSSLFLESLPTEKTCSSIWQHIDKACVDKSKHISIGISSSNILFQSDINLPLTQRMMIKNLRKYSSLEKTFHLPKSRKKNQKSSRKTDPAVCKCLLINTTHGQVHSQRLDAPDSESLAFSLAGVGTGLIAEFCGAYLETWASAA